MLKAMGLSSGKIALIIFSELFIISIVSIAYASLLATIFIKVSLGYLKNAVYRSNFKSLYNYSEHRVYHFIACLGRFTYNTIHLYKSNWQSSRYFIK